MGRRLIGNTGPFAGLLLIMLLNAFASFQLPVFASALNGTLSQAIPISRNTAIVQSTFDHARKKARTFADSILPLFGSFKIAEYYFEIQIGTPGQPFYVQADTGSSSTAIPMVDCKEGAKSVPCHVVKDHYDPMKSSTSVTVPCNSECSFCYARICAFRLQYGDGSKIEGPVMMDRVSVGIYKFGMTFGGVKISSTGFERGPVDGISGFASIALSPSDMDSFFDALIQSNPMDEIFSMCLGWEGGFIVFGGYESRFNDGDIKYVPMAFSNFYSIKILGIYVPFCYLQNILNEIIVLLNTLAKQAIYHLSIYSYADRKRFSIVESSRFQHVFRPTGCGQRNYTDDIPRKSIQRNEETSPNPQLSCSWNMSRVITYA